MAKKTRTTKLKTKVKSSRGQKQPNRVNEDTYDFMAIYDSSVDQFTQIKNRKPTIRELDVVRRFAFARLQLAVVAREFLSAVL